MSELFDAEFGPMRKHPRQARSRATVARIKSTMLELLKREGYAGISTNHIARASGINIASIYQYFPNRQAIALALLEDAATELADVTHKHLTDSVALPLEKGLPPLISDVLDTMKKHRIALLQLPEEVPELRRSAKALSLETLAYNTSATYMRLHIGEVDETTLRLKLFFVQHLAMSMVRQFVLNPPRGISRRVFVAELTALIISYVGDPA